MRQADTLILDYARDGIELREKFFMQDGENIRKAAFNTAVAIASGGKLLICGNGGSAGDAQHIAGEFVNRFLIDRPALPAIALTTDTSVLTAIANDFAFNQVFARQVEALGKQGDILLAISTSGNSENVLAAAEAAAKKSLTVIGLTGLDGGLLASRCEILISVPSSHTPYIQELHLAAEHIFCELVDYYLFENVAEIKPFITTPKEC